jgi:hypothetical protein
VLNPSTVSWVVMIVYVFLGTVLQGVVFSESETGREGQAMVDPFQKGFVWC